MNVFLIICCYGTVLQCSIECGRERLFASILSFATNVSNSHVLDRAVLMLA